MIILGGPEGQQQQQFFAEDWVDWWPKLSVALPGSFDKDW
jgi:hypothetical protein